MYWLLCYSTYAWLVLFLSIMVICSWGQLVSWPSHLVTVTGDQKDSRSIGHQEKYKLYFHRWPTDPVTKWPDTIFITGSPLVLLCFKAHTRVSGKIENSTPCKIAALKNLSPKLCTCDYIYEGNHQFWCKSVWQGLLPRYMKYPVSGKKVTPYVLFYNSGKWCRILTKFCINNATSNCKLQNFSTICQQRQQL